MYSGSIYKIYDNTNGNVYYGSTSERLLGKRLAHHRGHYKDWCNGKGGGCKSFDIIKNGDYDISLVEKVNYEEKVELHRRERWYIENNECVNKNIPTRTKKEYYDEHKEELCEYGKKYYDEHKVERIEYSKKYYDEHIEVINEKKKVYREEHKDDIVEYRKKYYDEHKEVINEKKKVYREEHKDDTAEYNKRYREGHKDNIIEKNKKYREQNRDKINAKAREKRQQAKQAKELLDKGLGNV